MQPAYTTLPETDPAVEERPLLVPGEHGFESPYHHTALDRLYALGLDSYQLIPRLASLRSSQWERFQGRAMEISVARDGNAIRHPGWARFDQGMAVKLPDAPVSPSVTVQ